VILLTGDRVGTVVVWSVAGKVDNDDCDCNDDDDDDSDSDDDDSDDDDRQ